jgi:pyruvate dehydrogenase E1 component alpha subunit
VEKCPIKRLRSHLLENKIAAEKELNDIDGRAQAEVDEAAQFALASPEPDPARVMDGMYVEGGEPR